MKRFALSVAVCLLGVCVGDATAAIVSIVGDPGDGGVDVNGIASGFTSPDARIGTAGNNVRGVHVVYFFALPTFTSVSTITNAQLQIEYLGIAQFTHTVTPEFNVDVFGIDARPNAIIQASDYYDGDATFSSDALIQTGIITPSTASGNLTIASSSLLNFVKSLYNADGTPMAAFAAFRLNPDIDLPVYSHPYRGYVVATADNANHSFRPRLNLMGDVIPEPSTFIIWSLLGAIGFGAGWWRRRRTA